MLSSIPQPLPALPLDQTFYKMCVELSEIASAGYEMKLVPARAFDAFPDITVTLQFQRVSDSRTVADGQPNTPFAFHLNKFALPSEMPRAVHRFHSVLFRIPRSRGSDLPAQ